MTTWKDDLLEFGLGIVPWLVGAYYAPRGFGTALALLFPPYGWLIGVGHMLGLVA
jgi:hypothetical protein